jgi:hypothetical protein
MNGLLKSALKGFCHIAPLNEAVVLLHLSNDLDTRTARHPPTWGVRSDGTPQAELPNRSSIGCGSIQFLVELVSDTGLRLEGRGWIEPPF